MALYNRFFCTLLFTILFAINSNAQLSKADIDIDADFKKAKELYLKGEYSLANPMFKQLYFFNRNESNYPNHVRNEIKFYYILNCLILDDSSVIELARDFENSETLLPQIQILNYHLGEFYFRQNEFTNAIEKYSNAKINNLSNREIATLKFHKAYAHFALKEFKESKNLFNTIRQIPSDPNYIDANYYYGFLCFYDKQYAEALKAFAIADNDIVYKSVVPFYIAEIYYFTGEKEKALSFGEAALNREGAQMHALQLKQLVGHLYFDKKEYQKALPFLEFYVSKSEKVRREDLYELAFCYYSAKEWTKAIEGFKQLGGKEDSLAQNSMYLLADAYLKTNDKLNARNAFLFCSSNSSHKQQKEVSAFNYAKLSYEQGYLDIAIKSLQLFLTDNPKSVYQTESKELLISALSNTSNYKDAYILYEKLPEKSENILKIYPRILYARAVELINEGQLNVAENLFDELLKSNYNVQFIQLTNFWKGEIAYRKGNSNDAILFFNKYLLNPQSNGEANIFNAKYNLAYCYFKNENYNSALNYFEQIAKNVMLYSSVLEQDAYLRIADCNYMLKAYTNALNIYENIIAQNFKTSDYAIYQKAIIAGILGKANEKIAALENLNNLYPNSNLVGDALLEIANTYMASEDYEKAIPILQKILSNKSLLNQYPQAYLKLGIANFNLNKNQESLKYFTLLVKQYSNSQEAESSIEYIRNIFIEDQKTDEFINFMKVNGKQLSFNEEDSLAYRSAQIKLETNDKESALKGLLNYIYKYPTGKYIIEANYLTAEIYVGNKNNNAAIEFYEFVASKSPNKFDERSTLQSARILYFDKADFVKAEKYFLKSKLIASQHENLLEAMRGLLRCQYKLQKWNDALSNANDLLVEKNIATDDKMMANLIIAKSNLIELKYDEAIVNFRKVITLGKSEFSAEATYQIAEILFLKDNLIEAEKIAFDCIKKFGSYEYWLTKSYILLGDIYFKQKDLFNAEATYKSVLDNTTIVELKNIAKQKLEELIKEKDKINKVEVN